MRIRAILQQQLDGWNMAPVHSLMEDIDLHVVHRIRVLVMFIE